MDTAWFRRSSIRSVALTLALCSAVLLAGVSGARAGEVSGALTQDTTFTADDPTTVVGDLTVQAGVALMIEAGASIEVDGNYSITVKGEVDANGTSSNPIVFTSGQGSPSSGDWKGLSFTEVPKSSVLEHVEVRYAGTGISANGISSAATLQLQPVTIEQAGSAGLSVANSVVEIDGGTIENVGSQGILLKGDDTDATVSGVTVEQSGAKVRTGSCVWVRDDITLDLSDSELRRCKYGLRVRDGGLAGTFVTATGNAISENQIGVRVNPVFGSQPYPSQLKVRENTIDGNVDGAVSVQVGDNPRQTELDFTDNWWGTTDAVEIAGRIRDQSDDGGSAFVEFLPMWDSPPGENPSPTRTGPGGETFWSGRISETRSWRRADGPHVAVGAIVVNPSTSLTIEQGTEVQFLKNGIDAQGSLVVQGSEESRVQMGLHESSPVDRWPGIQIRGSSARSSRVLYATLEQVQTGVRVESIPQVGPEGYPELEGLLIKDSGRGVSIKNSRVDLRRSRIVNFDSEGVRATGQDTHLKILDKSTVAQEGLLTRTGTCVAIRNKAKVTIQTSTIATCNRGINVYSQGSTAPDVEVTGSVIVRNSVGFRIDPDDAGDTYPTGIQVNSNDLLGNEDWNVRVEKGNKPEETTLDFTQNWWGTTNDADIDAKIRDADDNQNLATVNFSNKLTEENGQYGLADINDDGQTDGFDLSILASAFGTLEGKEEYNPAANLNDDDRIDGFDLSLLGTRFGQLGATDLKRLQPAEAQLLATSEQGAPVDYASRPDSALKKAPTRLKVAAGAGPFAEGDTIEYRLRVEGTPSLFGLSARFRYRDGEISFARGQTGPFLSGKAGVSVLGLAEADQGRGSLGLTRTRGHGSPAGSGRIAALRFVAQAPLDEAPPLSLSDVGLLAPDGRTTYETGVEGTVGPPSQATSPGELRLRGNYPNPFSRSTTVSFSLPERTMVTIEVYDAMGRQVRTLANQEMKAGTHTLRLNGRGLASGMYFCRIRADGKTRTTRMSVVR